MKYLQLLFRLIRLRRNLLKSKDDIQAIQRKQLTTILTYAYDRSAYYRNAFEAHGITRDQIAFRPIGDFPVMDKDTLMTRYDSIVTVPGLKQEDIRRFDETRSGKSGLFLDRFHVIHSSGSTGLPRYFVYDTKAWDRMLSGIIRAALWDLSGFGVLKLLAGGLRILYIAAVDGRYGGVMAVGSGIDGLKGKQLHIDINTPLDTWISRIDAFNPNIIIGYPSALKILAELVETGEVDVTVKRVISCGEPLGPGMRLFFERVFRSIVINVYGASESLALGVETAAEDGMLLFDDLNCVEILDEQIFITSLYNFAQPLIRYRISDKLALQDRHTAGDAPFTRVQVLLSRDEEVMWFEDDGGRREFLHPLSIEGFCIEGLIDFQFSQTGSRSFTMLAQVPDIRKRSGVESTMQSRMQEILSEKNLDYVDFSVRFIEEILPDPDTGKKPLILQNLTNQTIRVHHG